MILFFFVVSNIVFFLINFSFFIFHFIYLFKRKEYNFSAERILCYSACEVSARNSRSVLTFIFDGLSKHKTEVPLLSSKRTRETAKDVPHLAEIIVVVDRKGTLI